VSNALKYIQIGKPIATDLNPVSTKAEAGWTLR